MSDSPTPFEQANALLRELGATDITHPGGTLLAHLHRVHDQLAVWGARPALQLAGLAHAFYGTDGFATALLPLERRAELASVVGDEAEALVYLYASCDRKATHPRLTDTGAPFHDRFTGTTSVPGRHLREDFAELTAANELDLLRVSPEVREKWGEALRGMFTRFRPLLSHAAWADCESVLGQPLPD